MKNEKYVFIATPRGSTRISKEMKDVYNEPEIIICNEIYMNLLGDGWDVERCDSVVYVLKDKDFKDIVSPKKYEISFKEGSYDPNL